MSILNKDFSKISGKFRNFNILQSLCKICLLERSAKINRERRGEGEVDIEYLVNYLAVIIKVITRDIGIHSAMVPW